MAPCVYFELNFRKNFGGANLFITLDRLEMMDMTIPYHIDRACFMVPKAKVMKRKVAAHLPLTNVIYEIRIGF